LNLFISNKGNFRRHFVCFSLRGVLATHTRDGAIFSKNSTFVFFDGANANTENGS